ncbi:hypothetical protein HD554DRAFT_1070460 [Boletus coccyginus]|nr:hypothetical protein HD554DRAFT_1070460 [Boletus coccyginus]
MKSQTPRLYVFEKDEPIPWEAVRQHAEVAKTSGLNIHCEVYEESALVAYVRLDPKRYRTSIEDLLEIVHRESQVKATQNIVGSSVGVTNQNLVQVSMMSMLVIRSLVTWAYLEKKNRTRLCSTRSSHAHQLPRGSPHTKPKLIRAIIIVSTSEIHS